MKRSTSSGAMSVGDIIRIKRKSYDANGEIWRWEELALVTREDDFYFYMYTPYNEKFEIKKTELPCFEVISHIKKLNG